MSRSLRRAKFASDVPSENGCCDLSGLEGEHGDNHDVLEKRQLRPWTETTNGKLWKKIRSTLKHCLGQGKRYEAVGHIRFLVVHVGDAAHKATPEESENLLGTTKVAEFTGQDATGKKKGTGMERERHRKKQQKLNKRRSRTMKKREGTTEQSEDKEAAK